MNEKEEVRYNLQRLADEAEAGNIEAFLCVSIIADSNGNLVPQITSVVPGTVNRAKVETAVECLWGIAHALQTVVNPPATLSQLFSSEVEP